MKVSGGIKEDGVVVGNTYDKYNSSNLIVRKMMQSFDEALSGLVSLASPNEVHEIGCGEGYWVIHWNKMGIKARGSDFSSQVVDLARENAKDQGLCADVFTQRSIYDMRPNEDIADLVVCCEVLEHLEAPEQALLSLQKVVSGYLILSVPRERIWCALNLARGKYLSKFGNTPGHIQHWSKRDFVQLVSKYFKIIEVRSPFPWTMLLCSSLD